MSNRPPEGRRAKHNKPMIPAPKPLPQQATSVAQSFATAGLISGMSVVRRMIYQSSTGREQWFVDMLVAINAARQLGVQTFEIGVDGEPERKSSHSSSPFTIMFPSAAEPWQNAASSTGCVVTIFAVVVE